MSMGRWFQSSGSETAKASRAVSYNLDEISVEKMMTEVNTLDDDERADLENKMA